MALLSPRSALNPEGSAAEDAPPFAWAAGWARRAVLSCEAGCEKGVGSACHGIKLATALIRLPWVTADGFHNLAMLSKLQYSLTRQLIGEC